MKKINMYLVIGLIIVLFFSTMMVFPTLFTNTSPYEITGVESTRMEDGNYSFKTPPFEPGTKFPFGSDDSGRDILSFVIYGAKLTLSIGLSVAVLRFLLGLILGIGSAFNNQMSTLLVDQFNNVFNAIPPLIICIIVLSIGYLKALPKEYSIIVFISIMTLVEWARIAVLIRERAEIILDKDFIKSELIIGKSNRGIVIENLLPHMFSELIVLFFMEISRVLTLMMQLGIFGIFIGNLQIVLDTSASGVIGKATSYEPEWASMLGSSKNYIRVAPWIVLSCALAFFASVLGFNFVGEGLRMMYQEGRKLFKNKRQQLSVLGLIIAIFMAGFISSYEPVIARASSQEKWLLPANESLMGMPENQQLAALIESKFIDMNLATVKDHYKKPYDTEDYKWVTSAELFVETDHLSYKIDEIELLSFGSFSGSGQLVDLRSVNLLSDSFESKAFRDLVAEKFVLLDGSLFDEEGILYFSQKLMEATNTLGVIVPVDQVKEKMIGLTTLSAPVIKVNRSQVDDMIGKELSINIDTQDQKGQGINIVGQIISPTATDKTKGVLIGFKYNYLDKKIGQEQITYAMSLVDDIVENQSRLKRNITIVFWDGTYDEKLSGLNSYYTEYYYPIKHSMLYIDMTGLFSSADGSQSLIYNDDYVSLVKPDTYSMSEHLFEALEEVSLYKEEMKESYSVFYHKRGIPTIYLGTDGETPKMADLERLKNAIVETLVKEVY